ncbi:UNVERIFIED_ORG: transposase-like protein [Bacillus sp. PvP124]|nr:transposase-like protein [Bacillus sp. PvP124]
MYLYRVVDSRRSPLGFCLRKLRNNTNIKRFQSNLRSFYVSVSLGITVDKNPLSPIEIQE